MAVLSTATASGKQFCSALLTTSNATYYTAPVNNTNVTSPSSTAYIKEIVLCNGTSSAVTVNIYLVASGGSPAVGNGNCLFPQITINPFDTKVIGGLNTMMPAGSTIQASSNTLSAVNLIVSGVEVQ